VINVCKCPLLPCARFVAMQTVLLGYVDMYDLDTDDAESNTAHRPRAEEFSSSRSLHANATRTSKWTMTNLAHNPIDIAIRDLCHRHLHQVCLLCFVRENALRKCGSSLL
jgi:hypothetical protein